MDKRINQAAMALLVVFGITACGGGDSSSDDNDPIDTNNFTIRGEVHGINGGEIEFYFDGEMVEGIIDQDGQFEAKIPFALMEEDILVRVEARSTDQKKRVRALLGEASDLLNEAGADNILDTEDDAHLVSIDELDIGKYAYLVARNGGDDLDDLSVLHQMERDEIDPGKMLYLGAAANLVNSDGHALPEGVTDSWQLLTDLDLAGKFLQDIDGNAAVSKSYTGLASKAATGEVADAVSEVMNQAQPFTAADIPESYVLTQTSREFEDFKGGVFEFNTDGTGTYSNAAGTASTSWEISGDGKLVVTPESGNFFEFIVGNSLLIDEQNIVYEWKEEITSLSLTLLSQGPYADTLRIEFTVSGSSAGAPNGDVSQTIGQSRLMIGVKPGGNPVFTDAEVYGTWALPGLGVSDPLSFAEGYATQVLPVDLHVRDDDLLVFNTDGSGATVDGADFSWLVNAEGILVLTFDDGVVVEVRKARIIGNAFDLAVSVTDSVSGAIYVNGGIGLAVDPTLTGVSPHFVQQTMPGSYVRYGLGDGALENVVDTPFTMTLKDDNTVVWPTDYLLDWQPGDTPEPPPTRAWVISDGKLVIDQYYNRIIQDGQEPWEQMNPACSSPDPDVCFSSRQVIHVPIKIDGERTYVLEKHVIYQTDWTLPFARGPVWQEAHAVTYWESSGE